MDKIKQQPKSYDFVYIYSRKKEGGNLL